FTVGYKALPLFSHWQQRSSLFARILPSLKSLEVATAAGFSSNQLIALRPHYHSLDLLWDSK
ncbi:MAG: precorrin-6A/cobalt-precorrin-6A reductase, partial [Merismopedia sp. SIO2A8]|nr:precorrin-6A/cobalt-precorrin-6A reductase [Merismopedia sp. SIO2A8]